MTDTGDQGIVLALRRTAAGGEVRMAGEGRFEGVYPMLYAFFGKDGKLDRAAMRAQVELCVAGGVHGIAALGLGTEVAKLSAAERRQILEWVAEDLGRRLPLAITVFGQTPGEQIDFVRAAAAEGADWLILQPPRGEAPGEADLVRFFGKVADTSSIPVGIQNAAQYIGVGLSDAGLEALNRQHPNVRLIKAEGSALETRALIELIGGRMAIFQGRGGLELTDILRAGCAGMIPSVESAHVQARIFRLMRTGREEDMAEAERLYGKLVPLITFLMQSVDQFLCYGKRLTAKRIGVTEVHDRAPAQAPTVFGLTCLERHATVLDSIAQS
jgi:2-keto-3-deoxy-L-arabinonate dehydratase